MAGATSLAELAAALPAHCSRRVLGVASTPVRELTHDSRAVRPGSMFACVRGANVDGHELAAAAVASGATALLVDHPLDVAAAQLVVADVRRCLGPVADAVYGSPSQALDVVGITGTNGKTTTAHLLGAVLDAAGRSARVIGTLSGARTTPEAPELQRRLAGYVADGAGSVVMEVSSHALELHRVDGTSFALGVFTNLGEDHLDLHGSMEAYFRAKARLFEPGRTKLGVVNVDDPHGRLLADAAGIDVVAFAADDAADIRATASEIRLTWRGTALRARVGGDFNVMNVLAAATSAEALGVGHDTIAAGLDGASAVPGRFERVPGGHGFDVIVDYAHTPEGIASVLAAAHRLTAERATGRVIVVFGCGGDRDVHKRPRMGAAAALGSDVTIVTSDNPRHEQPKAIIDAVVAGVEPERRRRLIVEPDRATAIGRAIDEAAVGDVVVIAGKGHETSQVIGEQVLPFDDRLVAADALDRREADR